MDTTDSLGNGIGGGEILQFWGNNADYNLNSPYLNNDLIRLYNLVPLIRILIIGIIIFIMVRILMGFFNIKSFRKGKGIINELDYIEKVKKRDASILRYNRLIAWATSVVERSPFKLNRVNKEYLEYNLYRANIRIPGGSRTYKAEEFHALVVIIAACICLLGTILTLLANYVLGITLIVFTIIMSSMMPMMVLRQMVKAKDLEIKENFSDFYLMLHYVLLVKSRPPLTGIMRSYAKTTDSAEMKALVDTCTHYMDTYGEYEGTRYISKAYREIPVMGKLMRLIRQALSGGNVETELLGFRQELLAEKKYAIGKRTDKLIKRARASFNLLMPILFQAILSAMSIYFSDMGLISTFV